MPALLGLRALHRMHALLDVRGMRLYRVGPGGYSLKLPPGSATSELVRGTAGHLMLPCSEFHVPARKGPATAFMAERASSASSPE